MGISSSFSFPASDVLFGLLAASSALEQANEPWGRPSGKCTENCVRVLFLLKASTQCRREVRTTCGSSTAPPASATCWTTGLEWTSTRLLSTSGGVWCVRTHTHSHTHTLSLSHTHTWLHTHTHTHAQGTIIDNWHGRVFLLSMTTNYKCLLWNKK